jgi:hypothetical protein
MNTVAQIDLKLSSDQGRSESLRSADSPEKATWTAQVPRHTALTVAAAAPKILLETLGARPATVRIRNLDAIFQLLLMIMDDMR